MTGAQSPSPSFGQTTQLSAAMTDNYPHATALPSVVLPSYVLTARSLAESYSNQPTAQESSDANTLLEFTAQSRSNSPIDSAPSSSVPPLNRPQSPGSNSNLPKLPSIGLHQLHRINALNAWASRERNTYTPNPDESDDPDDEDYQDMLRNKWSCNSIRMKVKKFLALKTMTQTALLKKIEVNSNSFGRFMKYKGAYTGSDNSAYSGLLHFFYQLEKKEKKEKEEAKKAKKAAPKRKAKEAAGDSDDEPIAPKKAKTQPKENVPPVKKGKERLAEIEAVHLPPDLLVYDDCDVVRDHIIVYLARKECTQVALAEHFECSVASIRKFLAMKGVREGSGSIVYKAAYYFFEKLRILEGRPKTAKRLRIEQTKPEGYSLVRDPTRFWVLCRP